jgi:glycosyltransferase involved in cell wall biosynthesis
VTCLCLTRNRRRWLPQAIACFETQTYQPRELLILADGEDVRDLLPDAPNVRLIHLSDCKSIGEKRNFGCEQASGEIICHWDDDDHSTAGRLVDQILRLTDSEKQVTGYHSMRFTDGERWWLYQGQRHYALGTSLCYRKEWQRTHPFKALQVGEDNAFVAEAWNAGQLVAADAADLMYATIHPGNTSPRNLGSNWKLL